jgi:hypothetical protein
LGISVVAGQKDADDVEGADEEDDDEAEDVEAAAV